jgi:hypothetical protein
VAVAELRNRTPFAARELYTADEEGVPALVVVVKVTVSIVPGARCVLAAEQVPVTLEGEPWGDDSATSSYKYEPETALVKPGTDVVVIGHAHARPGEDRETLVGIEAGPLRKMARVFGARRWDKRLLGFEPTPPEPFETVPLVWEECYGGRATPVDGGDEGAVTEFEPRNPVGKGFLARRADPLGTPLPRIEDFDEALTRPTQSPPPAGFGFVSPHWQPRASFAGTYDEQWVRERAPLLPRNFDRRFYNAGAPGLVSATHLRGDEGVRLLGLSPGGTVTFGLPGFAPPQVTIHRRASRPVVLPSNLDTIIVEPDDGRVQLAWRTHLLLDDGPHTVREIQIEGMPLDRMRGAAP